MAKANDTPPVPCDGVDQKVAVWSYNDGGHRRWAVQCYGCGWLYNGRSTYRAVFAAADAHLQVCELEG